ncbi:unnamed protein product [Paramecium sonneborni]|uniref:Secreted protein n=1 Tax=Paramecium sonneborni TaxID=65129 RepID=A0A8S1PTV3_9CILI|nr:unnamed protein product [Paramecium sonneborni]
MIRQYKLILLMPLPIIIKAIHQVVYTNTMMQLNVMIRQYKLILMRPLPILIKAVHQNTSITKMKPQKITTSLQ